MDYNLDNLYSRLNGLGKDDDWIIQAAEALDAASDGAKRVVFHAPDSAATIRRLDALIDSRRRGK